MGGTNYSTRTFQQNTGAQVQSMGAQATFQHSAAVKSGQASGIAEHLDPKKKNGAGAVIRECRDSDAHPETVPIIVLMDVTGSMYQVPVQMLPKIPTIPATLVEKGFVDHPSLCFMAVDDAKGGPLVDCAFQASQFESGNEMDEALKSLVLVGNGNGNEHESYELAFWYIQNRVVTDAWEKRKEKGYLFVIGDEKIWPGTYKSELLKFCDPEAVIEGNTLETEDIIEALKEKWNIYWIVPTAAMHHENEEHYRKFFGERVFLDVETDAVTELIAMTIGAEEGHDIHNIAGALKAGGSSEKAVLSATTALASYSGLGKNALVKKSGTVTGELPEDEEAGASGRV